VHIARRPPELVWRALAGDEEVGIVRAFVRPDRRCYVRLESPRVDACELLLAAVAEDVGRDLHATIDETDGERSRLYERHGFVLDRRESEYRLPTDPAVNGLSGVEAPAGFVLVGADEVEEGRLRALDDALRQDVPGADGWRWDEAGFRAETFESPAFDPATYRVAVEERSGEHVGLARVWNNPDLPRLGLIAVLAPYRRRGLARALLANAFAVLHGRGATEVSAEVDDANVASRTLVEGLGARRTGGSTALIRRVHAA
jgi:ribosomal protein S18 acetylase RimI-like enzyme